MATSGRINTSSSNGSYFYVKWQLAQQDITNNRSLITWQAGLHISGGEYWLSNAVRINSGNVHTDSIPGGTWSNISGAGDHQLRSGSVWVNHNSDGTKSFSANISGWLYSYSNRSRSGSWSLPTIPRATQPSIPSSFNVGSSVTISLPRASSSFTHVVTYSFNGQSGTISSNAGSSVVWNVPTALANARPNNVSGTGVITAKTYNGSKLIGTKTDGFTANIPDTSSFKPTISNLSITEGNEDVASHFSAYIQSKSQLHVTFDAEGAYGSTILKKVAATLSFDTGLTTYYTGDGITTDPLASGGDYTVTAFPVDSRNRTVTQTEPIEVLPYTAPAVTTLTAIRTDASGNPDDDAGEYALVTMQASITALNDENTKTFTLKYKVHGATEWTEIDVTPAVGYDLDDTYLLSSIDVDSAYDVQLDVTDYFSTTSSTASIPTAFTIMDFHVDGQGMSFGKVADQTNRLEIGTKLPLHIIESNTFEGDAGFIRMRRQDDSILSYVSKGADGTGLDMHIYDDTAWTGKVNFTEGGGIKTTGGGPIDFSAASEAKLPVHIGGTLVVAENTVELVFAGTTKTRWTIGDWTQYGLLATTSRPYYIQIDVPVGKIYTVKLNHLCATVQSPNTHWSHSGIGKIANDFSVMEKVLTSSLNANGDNYHPQTSECVQVLTEGLHVFGVWVRTTDATKTAWKGGGDSTDMGTSFSFGRSCVFTATLLNLEDV